MKGILSIAALLAISTSAFAGPFGLPDHQPDGFRDTGCEAEAQKPITNADGDVLYWNNSTCPAVGGNAGFGPVVAALAALYPPEDDGEEPPVEAVTAD